MKEEINKTVEKIVDDWLDGFYVGDKWVEGYAIGYRSGKKKGKL